MKSVLWPRLGVVAAVLSAVAALHAGILVPSLMHSVDRRIAESTRAHSQHVHPGAVSRADHERDIQLVLELLREIRADVRRLQ